VSTNQLSLEEHPKVTIEERNQKLLNPLGSNSAFAAPVLLPLKDWQQLLLRHLRTSTTGRLEPGLSNAEQQNLRELTCSHLNRNKATRCQPDQVFLFSEPKQALNAVANYFLDERDLVAVENVCNIEARNCFIERGAKLQAIATDDLQLQQASFPAEQSYCSSYSAKIDTGVYGSNCIRVSKSTCS